MYEPIPMVGAQGVLVIPHVARPMPYPDTKFKDLKFPNVAEENHWRRYVEACLGGTRSTVGFNYSGPLAQAVRVGTVALRFPKATLHWNAPSLAFTEAEPNRFVRRTYRAGWGVRGLS
jgi:hypothetical protein